MRAAPLLLLGLLLPVQVQAEDGRLRNLLEQDCGSCHGLTRKGGLGSPLLPERLAAVPVAALAAIILDGLPGTAMPPWRGLIDEAQALRLAQMLKNPPAPPGQGGEEGQNVGQN